MLVAPRRLKVVSEIGGLVVVEIDDPLNRVLLTIRFDQHRKGREGESIRFEYQVIRNPPRGVQVFRHQRGRDGERLPRVVETGLVGGIDRELARRTQVYSR